MMKHFFIALSAIYFMLSACVKTNHTSTSDTSQQLANDSIKIASIDSMVEKIGPQWKLGPNFHKVPISNQGDTLEYIEIDGSPQRISSKFISDTAMYWIVFYVIDSKLSLVRYRNILQKPKPSVKETFSYLENEKIFFTKERSKDLAPDEAPSIFRSLPFVENARTPAEVEAEYAPYWNITKKTIEDYRKNKK